ncbi:MAG TPA: phosphoribosylglycinamide formyltransferase [Gammaproteobacteria bacterium]|jgi:phosphoribosylglycinamide formyltransferase-1|nr:phosphoribosylglycinamide formyltransferase [Gammaproteobacteria bacterium]
MVEEKELLRLVVMISGNGSNLQAIIDAIGRGKVAARLVAVVSDKADAFGLERARKAGVPAQVVSPKDFDDRAAWQAGLLKTVDSFSPGLVVLAGFMRILDDAFVAHFSGRMINIHPSLLPALRGLHTHRRALAEQLSHHGTSVHFVTPELDGGPVILQARVPVRPEDDEATLTARVQAAEHVIYPRVIQWFATGRVRLYDNGVALDGEVVATPPVMDFN